MVGESYILICAGEDSGDVIGESLICALRSRSVVVKGAGGCRMQTAGMISLVDFGLLPVSGFGDVLPRYLKLRRSYNVLKSALESPECLGLVAIDYPGFNMKLVERAGELRKPALYVAPPQVWAWKKKRAKVLARNPYVKLAVFFDFEEQVYREAGCNVVRVKHPFVNSEFGIRSSELYFERHETLHGIAETEAVPCPRCLLLPGSRKSQALRNLPIFLKAVRGFSNVVVVAARQELAPVFEKFGVQVIVAPQNAQERAALYRNAKYAVTAPGTATLELALSGIPFAVCTKPDLLTYCLGRLFVKTKYFALPNIILNEQVYPEYILRPFQEYPRLDRDFSREDCDASAILQNDCGRNIYAKISVGQTLEQLATEFLRQFVEGKAE